MLTLSAAHGSLPDFQLLASLKTFFGPFHALLAPSAEASRMTKRHPGIGTEKKSRENVYPKDSTLRLGRGSSLNSFAFLTCKFLTMRLKKRARSSFRRHRYWAGNAVTSRFALSGDNSPSLAPTQIFRLDAQDPNLLPYLQVLRGSSWRVCCSNSGLRPAFSQGWWRETPLKRRQHSRAYAWDLMNSAPS